MANKTLFRKFSQGKINWQESYPSFILGAVIVIILGLLVANFFTRKGTEQIGGGEQTQQQEGVGAAREYEVVAGDSLSKIAEKFYDSQELWPALAQVNNIVNPNLVYVGAKLSIPEKGVIEETRAELSTTSYEVAAGETLFIIAQKVYGDGGRWTVLLRANRVGRLPNGNPLIFAGSTLSIPR